MIWQTGKLNPQALCTMDASNNNFVELLGADIAKNEQLLKEQPIIAPEPLKAPAGGYTFEEIQQIVEASTLNLQQDSQKPPFCLFFDDLPVLGLGDISTIIGKAKSRKTFATGLLLASVAGNAIIQDRIKGSLPEDKRNVLFIDTEQAEYYAKNSSRRVLGLLNLDYKTDSLPNFKAISLRQFNPHERLQIIEWLIYNTPDLGFVIIDGIRDLITSINDEEQATMITSKLLKWSTERMIHISCVLHMNKGDNNARGHVGTELMNKSLTVLGVSKVEENEEYSTIEPIATRDREFKPIVFGIDEEGLPYILSDNDADALKTETGKPKAKDPTDWNNEQHAGILERMFKNEPQMKSGDFINAIKLAYEVGTNKAQIFVAYFKKESLIKWQNKGTSTIYSIV